MLLRWMWIFTVFAALTGASVASAQQKETTLQLKPYSVTISVIDIEHVAKWYERVLGFQRISAKQYPQFKTSLIFLANNGFRVELIADGNAKKGLRRADPPAHTATTGVSQFAFEVADIDDAHARLTAEGVDFAWELQRYPDLGVAFFFVRDPEGNLVQFVQKVG